MPTTLPDIFAQEGTLEVVGGNTPFLLDDPESVWYIQRGHVEVFSVQVKDGQPHGGRYHFFGADAGTVLFGMDLKGYGVGWGFLGVGLVGTHLRRLPLARFRALVTTTAYAAEGARLVEGWVQALSQGISKDLNPRTDLALEPGTETTLEDRRKVRARRGVGWLRFVEGEALFIGMESLALAETGALFPLTADTWVQALGRVHVTTLGTEEALRQAACWDGLAVFYRLLLLCEMFNTRLVAVDAFNRLQARARHSREATRSAVEGLAAVLDPQPSVFSNLTSSDPLLAACQMVGEAMGFSMVPPPAPETEEQDSLERIARASGVRFRRVALQEAWWTGESGPLLGFLDGGERPVALLPSRHPPYTLHDPSTHTSVPVTAAVAAGMHTVGYALYRPLPTRPVEIGDLLRLGFHDVKEDLLAVLLVGLAGGLLATVTPIATGLLFDTIIPGAARGQLLQLTLALLVASLAGALFHLTRQLAVLRVEGRMDASIQAAIWDRLLSLPVPFFRDYAAGDLALRANGIGQIRWVLSGTVVSSLLGGLFAVFNFALLFYYSPRLALIAIVLTFVALAAMGAVSVVQLRYQHQIAHLQGRLSSTVLQLIRGIGKLRVAGAEAYGFALWARDFARQRTLTYRARQISNGYAVFSTAFPVLTSMVLFAAVVLWSGTTFTTGQFLAFFAAFGLFLSSVMAVGGAATAMLSVVPSYRRLMPILAAVPEVTAVKADPGALSGAIEVSRVSFRYRENGPLVLHDVSLQIRPGAFVALVGPSGSGKSTLLRLLLGFEAPETGTILYDGQDLASLDVLSVRRRIGVVLQHSQVMPGDLLSNIVGARTLSLAEAWDAAHRAGLDDDIRKLPMGMHTIVSAGGGTFSGGQRQRLMIARAIATRPRILFFDEATSALDNRTQAVVTENLDRLQATRVVVAHRLSTIRNADCIYVIDNGRVVQQGTYDTLMVHENGLFAQLARRQMA